MSGITHHLLLHDNVIAASSAKVDADDALDSSASEMTHTVTLSAWGPSIAQRQAREKRYNVDLSLNKQTLLIHRVKLMEHDKGGTT